MKKSYEITIAILTITLALSGWGTIIYQNIQNKPKLKGEILIEIGSEITLKNKDILMFSPYIFLTNIRDNTVYIKSVSLVFEYKGIEVRFEPDYTIRTTFPNMQAVDSIIGQTSFKEIANNSIFYKDLEVKYGCPLQGFISFPMDKKYESEISKSKYSLIITDIFGRDYIIKQKRKFHWVDFDWFEHFSGVKIYNLEKINSNEQRTKY